MDTKNTSIFHQTFHNLRFDPLCRLQPKHATCNWNSPTDISSWFPKTAQTFLCSWANFTSITFIFTLREVFSSILIIFYISIHFYIYELTAKILSSKSSPPIGVAWFRYSMYFFFQVKPNVSMCFLKKFRYFRLKNNNFYRF